MRLHLAGERRTAGHRCGKSPQDSRGRNRLHKSPEGNCHSSLRAPPTPSHQPFRAHPGDAPHRHNSSTSRPNSALGRESEDRSSEQMSPKWKKRLPRSSSAPLGPRRSLPVRTDDDTPLIARTRRHTHRMVTWLNPQRQSELLRGSQSPSPPALQLPSSAHHSSPCARPLALCKTSLTLAGRFHAPRSRRRKHKKVRSLWLGAASFVAVAADRPPLLPNHAATDHGAPGGACDGKVYKLTTIPPRASTPDHGQIVNVIPSHAPSLLRQTQAWSP